MRANSTAIDENNDVTYGAAEPIRYDGRRDAKGIWQWIKKHHSHPTEISWRMKENRGEMRPDTAKPRATALASSGGSAEDQHRTGVEPPMEPAPNRAHTSVTSVETPGPDEPGYGEHVKNTLGQETAGPQAHKGHEL